MKKGNERLKVGITLGDPNGVGVETILKVFSDPRMYDEITPVIYGQKSVVKFYRNTLKQGEVSSFSIKDAADAQPKKFNLVTIDCPEFKPEPGTSSKEAGKVALASLTMAVQDLASNKVDVLVTCPIDKETIQSDDFKFPGHTEYLAQMSNVEDHLMLLVSPIMKIGVVTGHIPLKDVSGQISKDKIIGKLKLMNESLLKDFGSTKPRIAVLGLNPHAGDNGLLGEEEADIIGPAVKQAQEEGMLVYGPFGSDGFFGTAQYKNFDAVLGMYHDQGLTPFKTLAFDSGVNYTAGLPIVRTSPDHGTAYDIAGKGEASPDSLRAAIFEAKDIYKNRNIYKDLTANPLVIKKKDN